MADDDIEHRIQLVAETAHITKVEVVTDRVRVATTVEERPVLVEDTIERGTLQVSRLPTDRRVTAAPDPRQDGDTLIVSIVEERLVVEKHLYVIEELHITRKAVIEPVSVSETVRVMHATVEQAPNS